MKIIQIQTKLLKSVKSMLKEGRSPRQITLCIALGVSLGIFPVLGMTTLLCTIAAFALRVNLPAIQAINFIVYPLQIILLAPFYGLGSWLFQQQKGQLIGEDLIKLFANDFWGSMASLWDLTLYAVISWLIVSPFLILLLYCLIKPIIQTLTASPAKL